ncbi:hypothetical protein QH73_0011190 [Scytonema millei VB511283]|uniref:Uncharacterized protein n=1 Tax=Scytonema millei VB511283 TaxID=1245923 RepID=A0A9X5I4S0_9CYAN|nr:hypothetical protein [Scytonema millei VB511283]
MLRELREQNNSKFLHPTPYTLHPTPFFIYSLHPTPYTLHPFFMTH